jgi:hypothetical protein
LDFKNKYDSLEAPPIKPLLKTQKEISKKAMEAKAYRQKLLQQKQDEGKGGVQMSPGFAKEKQLQKRKVAAAKSLEGKATFAQCVFNMANILMVRH